MEKSSHLPFRTVMVVDDDAFLSEMYETKFKAEGAEVLPFLSTTAALRAVAEGKARPEVVLVDVVMPEMNGVEFVRRLRALPAGRDAIIIMLSNQSLEEDIARAREAGADDYLIKAYLTPSETVAKVAEIVRRVHQERANA